MLVIMRPDSSDDAIEAVRQHAIEAGLETNIFDGADKTFVSTNGVVSPDLKTVLETMPGVESILFGRQPEPLRTQNLRVSSIRPLIPPAILLEKLPLSPMGSVTVTRAREEIVRILDGDDDRLFVVVGPCSIHDTEAALDYARHLKNLADELAQDLCIIMRVYFEKPRTTVGWKGLVNDPHLDESFAVNDGLQLARGLLLDLAELGLPVGCEFLDPISPQFFTDTVSWGAIGARTTESQVHRELSSGLSMPIGFKNGTGGGLQMAVDALRAAAYPHNFLGVTEQGLAGIVTTRGNSDCHVILRGGTRGPNYGAEHVQGLLEMLRKVGLPERVMIDTSHGNSGKDYRRQPVVAAEIGAQIADGQMGIKGVLMESFLVEDRQDLVDEAQLVYGQSITDPCISWDTTVEVLQKLAQSVRTRRAGRTR